MTSPPGPLVDVDWLRARLDDERLRLCDCRWYLADPEAGRRSFAEAHLPGARYVALEWDLSDPGGPGRHALPPPEGFAAWLGEFGIGRDHAVVAYDDRGGAVAARLWWMLRDQGHGAVTVLDGGLAAWIAAGGPTSTQETTWPSTSYPDPRPWSSVDRAAIQAGLDRQVLIDARDPERFRGDHEPIDPVAGHIPGAVNLPYVGNLGADHRFLEPASLAARYGAAGVTDGEQTVVYCGSGVTACHDILALEVAGIAGARLYDGSWSDWSAAGLPVATEPN